MTENGEKGQSKMSGTSSVGRDGGITTVRAVVVVMLLALFLQFLLGMWLNLFATFPQLTVSSGDVFGGMMGSMMSFMLSGGMPVLMVHMMTGFVVLALAVIVLALSFTVCSDKKTIGVLLGVARLGYDFLAGGSRVYLQFSGICLDA